MKLLTSLLVAVVVLVAVAKAAAAGALEGKCYHIVTRLNVRDEPCGDLVGGLESRVVKVHEVWGRDRSCSLGTSWTWVLVETVDDEHHLEGYAVDAYMGDPVACPGESDNGRSSTRCCDNRVSSGRSNSGKMNNNGLAILKSMEGWRSCWYLDPVGYPTIGYGHLIVKGDPYKKGDCLTLSQGEALLKRDIVSYEQCAVDNTPASLNCNQFSALVDFIYNLGCGAYKSSTLKKKVDLYGQGKASATDVCLQLARWNKAGGRVLPGLTKRRQEECELFQQTC